MGTSPSSPTQIDYAPSMPWKPPETIVIQLEKEEVNNSDDDDDEEEEEEERQKILGMQRETTTNRLFDNRRTALGSIRDKAYRKLTTSIDEESALLMERKIQRYDARMQDIQYQEDRWHKECALYLDYLQHENMTRVWTTIGYWIFQGLLLVAYMILSNHHGLVWVLAFVGIGSSIIRILQIYQHYQLLRDIQNSWQQSYSGDSPLRELTLRSVHICLDFIPPLLFLFVWLGLLINDSTIKSYPS
jgi:hypothetical protein